MVTVLALLVGRQEWHLQNKPAAANNKVPPWDLT